MLSNRENVQGDDSFVKQNKLIAYCLLLVPNVSSGVKQGNCIGCE